MSGGSNASSIERKDDNGKIIEWARTPDRKLRIQMLPGSYLDSEPVAGKIFNKYRIERREEE